MDSFPDKEMFCIVTEYCEVRDAGDISESNILISNNIITLNYEQCKMSANFYVSLL